MNAAQPLATRSASGGSPGTLAADQVALLDALLQAKAPAHGWDAIGLSAYRDNAHAHAERAFAGTYPVVGALVGEETAHALARGLWHRHPPARGDLAEWGVHLAELIDGERALDVVPYLGDVARLEWAWHLASRARETVADPGSFALLQTDDPAHLHARLAAGTAVLVSHWPVLAIVEAHRTDEPDFPALRERLHAGHGGAVRVWRHGGEIAAQAIEEATARFEQRLIEGHSLGHALRDAPIDIVPWLEQAVREQRLLGIERSSRSTP